MSSITKLIGACVLLASSAAADFYVVQAVIPVPPVCGPSTGCVGDPPIVNYQLVNVNDATNCDVLNGLSGGTGGDGFFDPLCSDSGTNPFSSQGPVCGGDGNTVLQFRVSPNDGSKLDAAYDSDFTNIVASCVSTTCSPDGGQTCGSGTPNQYNPIIQCSPVKGSAC